MGTAARRLKGRRSTAPISNVEGKRGGIHMLRRRQTRHSRGDLLWGLTLFVVAQLGLAMAIECWLPQLCDPYYGYRKQKLLSRMHDSRSPP
jgi:hypothetical protein